MPEVTACPHCGVVPAALALTTWGDGAQRLAWAPFVCLACGGLALFWLATGRMAALGYDEEQYLRTHAPALWAQIEAARAARRGEGEGDPCP
jgi:hypothetical protein